MMKTIIVMIVMMLGMYTNIFANEVSIINRIDDSVSKLSVKDVRNFDFTINQRQLGDYLNLNTEDSINVAGVCDGFRQGMLLAGKSEDDSIKSALVQNSIDYAVQNMRYCLNREQYGKFLRTFNLTLLNRGFGEDIYKHGSKTIKN